MFLPISMEFNRDYTGERYREIARALGVKGVDEMSQEEYRDAAINAVRQLSEDVGIPKKNEKIREEDLDQLATDALNDACYPGNPREATKEQVIALADSADIWINPGMFSTAEEILGAEPRIARIKAFREKWVFQNDGRKGPRGGNDFYESAVAQPEKVLNDFVWAIGAFEDSEKADGATPGSRWYRNIFNFNSL